MPVGPVPVDPNPLLFLITLIVFIFVGLYGLHKQGLKMKRRELTQDDQWLNE